MSIGTVMSQNSSPANRRLPVGRNIAAAGRNQTGRGTRKRFRSFPRCNVYTDGDHSVNAGNQDKKAPPPVISSPPEHDLERKLKRNPGDPNTKVDVGSDESMDASDPSSAVHPGGSDEPAPSSTFPERRK